MSLSDMIFEDELTTEDVRWFIKELKEGIEKNIHLLDYEDREYYLKLIDKLAGDKLI